MDLAGNPNRRTGYCRLAGGSVTTTAILGDDDAIVHRIAADRPECVVIDAPLSLPRGRESLEHRGPPHLRECDRELLRHHIRFFPLSLGPMRLLTARGLALARRLRALGVPVWEGYPGATQDLMGWPRKGRGARALQLALRRFGFEGDVQRRWLTHDELDAIACAWSGWELVHRRAWVIGDPAEGEMVLARAAGGRAGAPAPMPRGGRRDP